MPIKGKILEVGKAYTLDATNVQYVFIGMKGGRAKFMHSESSEQFDFPLIDARSYFTETNSFGPVVAS